MTREYRRGCSQWSGEILDPRQLVVLLSPEPLDVPLEPDYVVLQLEDLLRPLPGGGELLLQHLLGLHQDPVEDDRNYMTTLMTTYMTTYTTSYVTTYMTT